MLNNPTIEKLLKNMFWYNLHFECKNEIITLFHGDQKINVSNWTSEDLENWIRK